MEEGDRKKKLATEDEKREESPLKDQRENGVFKRR